MPVELDEIERKITQLEIERQALLKENDPASKERLEKIEKETGELKNSAAAMKVHWQKEKEAIQKIRAIKERIEEAKQSEQQAEREGNLAQVAEIRYGRLGELQKQLETENQSLSDLQRERKMLKEEVEAEDVAEVVAKWTGHSR